MQGSTDEIRPCNCKLIFSVETHADIPCSARICNLATGLVPYMVEMIVLANDTKSRYTASLGEGGCLMFWSRRGRGYFVLSLISHVTEVGWLYGLAFPARESCENLTCDFDLLVLARVSEGDESEKSEEIRRRVLKVCGESACVLRHLRTSAIANACGMTGADADIESISIFPRESPVLWLQRDRSHGGYLPAKYRRQSARGGRAGLVLLGDGARVCRRSLAGAQLLDIISRS